VLSAYGYWGKQPIETFTVFEQLRLTRGKLKF